MDKKKAARLLFQLPRECRVFTAVNPAAQWGWAENFANKQVYLLELLAWQNATPNTKAKRAVHMRQKPTLWTPPFMRDKLPQSEINKGSVKRTVDDVKSILALPRGV